MQTESGRRGSDRAVEKFLVDSHPGRNHVIIHVSKKSAVTVVPYSFEEIPHIRLSNLLCESVCYDEF